MGKFVLNLCTAALNLALDNPPVAAALMEAGWADLLVRTLQARPDDKMTANIASEAIYSLLAENPAVCKSFFIAAGAITALKETKERHNTEVFEWEKIRFERYFSSHN